MYLKIQNIGSEVFSSRSFFFLNIYLDDTSKIKTYVGSDGKLHFVNKAGADTVLNFSNKDISGISGKWNLYIMIDINPGNSSTLGALSYVRLYLQKGIFQTCIYDKDITTFIGTETVNTPLSDWSNVFKSTHIGKIETCINTHNSSIFTAVSYCQSIYK